MRFETPLTALFSLPWYPNRTADVLALESAEARAAMAILTAKSRFLIDRSRESIAESRARLRTPPTRACAACLLKAA